MRQITGDSAYDNHRVYQHIHNQCQDVDIKIAPSKDAIYHPHNDFYCNRNILERKYYGKLGWQKRRHCGRRNDSELAILRYKTILSRQLHARQMKRQTQEMMIGCIFLNKFVGLGMPKTYKAA